MQTHHQHYSRLFLPAFLTGGCLIFLAADKLHTQTQTPATPAATLAVDPATHAAHIAAGTHPPTTGPGAAQGDPALSQQLAQLQAKVAQLEAALGRAVPPVAGPPMAAAPARAAMPVPGMPGAGPAASPAMSMGMDKMKSAMPGMSGGATPTPAMAGMSGAAAPAPAAGATNMMGMMDKMMGMMDKMMSTGGGPMPLGAPAPAMAGMGGAAAPAGGAMNMMGMMDRMMSTGGGAPMPSGGPMPATPPASGTGNVSGGGGMGMMDMMGMSGSAASMTQSALPGFPGASHLYHIGATGFFLDHTQHISLTTQQQAGLNKAKEQALLAKSTADRAVEQAEQALWTLTAADQPDAAQVEAKIREIDKLRGDERLAFIHAVGDASRLLTDEQRRVLTGFAPPAPANSMAAAGAAMPAGGMKDM